ncbi:type IV secretion system DNA-binding domain-containing protein [Candidatus Nomurabacteria bacterium]|nr:type IV secretion system DNA-binding domain-containing protein [Candidatus Nomurabacteria bacterium]
MYDPERITFFAKTDARGKNVPFGIKAKDRTRHVYVIGKTGMGKSTLLENMAVQDIRNGEGFAFIDPHGQTAETLLSYIPPERLKDVLYFAPHDMDYPVSFNVMEDVGADKRHLVVSGLMSVFEKIWVDAWSARMAYILQNTLMALLEYPDATLLGVNRMLSDKAYRNLVVANIKDPAVKSFWVDEFAKYNERYMQEAGDAIKNKIGQFTANPVIRNIIGQPKSSFDLRKIMDEKKIVIMNLSKGLIGETNANLLGSMLTTRIYLAAMSRADVSPEQMQAMPNFYFYVDEFQSFANATFANILSEARKYKLNLTIAHQYIEQMEEDVRNAVFGNVGTTIAFRTGPFDAEVLETVFAPKFMAVDLVNLGFAQVYLTLMIDGIGSAPFSATTLPPLSPPLNALKDELIESSRQQFAKPRQVVEDAIALWIAPVVEERKERVVDKTPKKVELTSARTETVKTAPARRTSSSYNNERRSEPTTTASSESKQENHKGRENQESHNGRDTREKREAPLRRAQTERYTPVAKPAQSSKSLEDLRAVLRQISQGEEKEVKSQSNKPADLKSALAAMVPPESKSEKREEKVVHEVKITDSATVTEESNASTNNSNTNDFDPKKLERMMRVKTDDKTPLK